MPLTKFVMFALQLGCTLAIEVIIPEAVEYTNGSLTCNFPGLNGNDGYKVNWFKNNTQSQNQLLTHSQGSTGCGTVYGQWTGRACGYFNGSYSYVVELQSIVLGDDMLYVCQVLNAGQTAQNTMTVIVVPANISTSGSLSTDTVTVLVKCSVARVNPVEYMRFRWFVDEEEHYTYTNTSSTNADGTSSALSTLTYRSCENSTAVAECRVEWKHVSYQTLQQQLPCPSGSDGLSGVAIAGITIAVTVVVGGAVGLTFYFVKRSKRKTEKP